MGPCWIRPSSRYLGHNLSLVVVIRWRNVSLCFSLLRRRPLIPVFSVSSLLNHIVCDSPTTFSLVVKIVGVAKGLVLICGLSFEVPWIKKGCFDTK